MNLPRKKIIIGRTCSPSKLIEINEHLMTKIKISFGGGMGGANRTIYAEQIMSDTKTDLIVKQFDNEIITINKEFIVYREPVKVISQISDTTAHSNYHGVKFQSTIHTHLYELKANDEWAYVDVITHENPKPFFAHTESK